MEVLNVQEILQGLIILRKQEVLLQQKLKDALLQKKVDKDGKER